MEKEDERKEVRLHIGHISKLLAAQVLKLETRLGKFGEISKGLELHTKPIEDHFFGFITLKINTKELEKIRSAFNGIQYMGLRLTLDISRPLLQHSVLNDYQRCKQRTLEIEKSKINETRNKRIKESDSNYHQNSITGSLITSSYLAPNETSLGYSKSAHTYNSQSASTKSSNPPSHSLKGMNSYGTWTKPKRSSFAQQYSNLSGRAELIAGRHRRTCRSDLHLRKHQTLRILINGELKEVRCYKTKLWGVEKNKSVNDLTWQFEKGEWKSGNNHIIERAKTQNPSSQLSYHENDSLSEDEGDPDEEMKKNKSILASMFRDNKFDLPAEIDDTSNEVELNVKGKTQAMRYDFEDEFHFHDSDSNDDSTKGDEDGEDVKGENLLDDYLKNAPPPVQDIYYDENDEGNDLEMSPPPSAGNKIASLPEMNSELGSSNENASKSDAAPSNTEALRSLFNAADTAQSAGGFKLSLSDNDDDIDNEQSPDLEEQKLVIEEIQSKKAKEEVLDQTSKNHELFWPHFKSPFLSSQSRLQLFGNATDKILLPGENENDKAKIGINEDEAPYEKWFWSMRGEITRECKRRKRDLSRLNRKKLKHILLL
ncbi:uncharacterized protein PRCAT00003294001 [Priceomyces carsonii]|uniref:uncharacterized protein n=1 Tax=Priceomyces carsonii TaxID=28549 RepID=UPI002ED9265B|nr:unnamed protein product [Priceomyces carsonii]